MFATFLEAWFRASWPPCGGQSSFMCPWGSLLWMKKSRGSRCRGPRAQTSSLALAASALQTPPWLPLAPPSGGVLHQPTQKHPPRLPAALRQPTPCSSQSPFPSTCLLSSRALCSMPPPPCSDLGFAAVNGAVVPSIPLVCLSFLLPLPPWNSSSLNCKPSDHTVPSLVTPPMDPISLWLEPTFLTKA